MDSAAALGELESQGAAEAAAGEEGGAAEGEPGAEAGAEPGAAAGDAESGTEAGEAEPGEQAEPEPAKGPVKFTPEQQKVFDARLGKEVGKRKAAEEKLTALEAELATAKSVADETQVQAAQKLQVLSEYLKPGEAQVLASDDQMAAFEDWATENWDGFEAPEGGKSYTAAQIRKRYQEVQREHARIGRQADEIRTRARKDMLADLHEGRAAKAARLKAEAALKSRVPAKPGTPVEPKPAAGLKSGDRPNPEAVFEKKGKNRDAAAEALGMM
jgi:hypothetical protein